MFLCCYEFRTQILHSLALTHCLRDGTLLSLRACLRWNTNSVGGDSTPWLWHFAYYVALGHVASAPLVYGVPLPLYHLYYDVRCTYWNTSCLCLWLAATRSSYLFTLSLYLHGKATQCLCSRSIHLSVHLPLLWPLRSTLPLVRYSMTL